MAKGKKKTKDKKPEGKKSEGKSRGPR